MSGPLSVMLDRGLDKQRVQDEKLALSFGLVACVSGTTVSVVVRA